MSFKNSLTEKRPRLTLVGAGPGDHELITVKGAKALKDATVILYDALIDPKIFEYASPRVIRRFVGKRCGLHTYSQEEINEMIVSYALTYGHVVRLKGGDPFVFGRGYEELAYAGSFGIETDVIPGVTSATSLPALKKIPLTTRGLNESFWVLTGTTADRKISNDIFLAAQTNATVVILMGLKKLGEIAGIYKEAGKKDLPVAVIVNGSLPNEQFIRGTISDIQLKISEYDIHGPALILIGEAVGLQLDKDSRYIENIKAQFA
ncbi:MAG: uroporphyrinogen-III C-methyltransferase [Chitinophagaceae bacterium]|jgi:uroporphyrin-III C-methyltransferase|nr:MAG: uroporphyrinogen-III C-methyltransferase [Chitinophagaceae bacterium]